MTQTRLVLLLAFFVAIFAAADHFARPEPDHYSLEQWRAHDLGGGCAPCGAICDDK